MNQIPTRRFPPLRQARATLLLALPLLLIANVICYGGYTLSIERKRAVRLTQMENGLDAALITMERLSNDLNGDLFLLAASPNFRLMLEDPTPARLDLLAAEWETFAATKRRYDQIRWIDNRGTERLRVNLTARGASRIADVMLQDKSDRYYFKQAISLRAGQVYASPIDLNIEHGEVELPFKPMLRLAVPVSTNKGERQGLLLVNVLAKGIFEDLARHAGLAQGHLLMIDPSGYYLRGFHEDQEWGFMFQRQDDGPYRFDKEYPEVWRQMVRQGAGKADMAEGLFLFRSLSYGSKGFGQRYFTVAAVLPGELALAAAEQKKLWLLLSLVFSLLLFLLSLSFSYCLRNRSGIA